ncbi:hypothetical protein [Endozoicomonas sp. GU-1]|uniref:hypothetical protein n=1 Tax=Endozoicomonas sp. GU-1 TaxID=3009078 RepID=UPI0022B45686|nr:hypothetical protein [Endozoicomonas sp. GU-1]WBA86518.1 hypothetical protein O3276_00205 [Endozoicomonas sp. GU-1]
MNLKTYLRARMANKEAELIARREGEKHDRQTRRKARKTKAVVSQPTGDGADSELDRLPPRSRPPGR